MRQLRQWYEAPSSRIVFLWQCSLEGLGGTVYSVQGFISMLPGTPAAVLIVGDPSCVGALIDIYGVH